MDLYLYRQNWFRYKMIGVFQIVFLTLSVHQFITNWNATGFFLAFLIAHIWGTTGIAIIYHRIIAHRVVEVKNKFVLALMCFIGVNSICVGPAAWAFNHIQHHRYADTDKDPHTPTKLGWKAFWYIFHQPLHPNRLSERESRRNLVLAKHLNNEVLFFFETWLYPILAIIPVTLWLTFDYSTMVYYWMWPCFLSMIGLLPSVLNHGGLLGGQKVTGQNHQARDKYLVGYFFTPFDVNHASHHENPREDDWLNRQLRKVFNA
jgi:fatty-acid desaturase